MVEDRLLTEIERQQKYLDQLPEDFSFPLFNAKTALESQRSSGYKDTASATRELIDNAIEAGATKVHVIFFTFQEKGRGKKRIVKSVAVIDNGSGMLPKMARYALTWGGGTHFDDPSFIGKFGFGLPNASINQTRLTEVYTRVKGARRIVKAELDIDRFSAYGVQTIPDPAEVDALPDFVERYLRRENWNFDSGTVVVWRNPDRLTYKTPANLKQHLIDDFGVVYRYLLNDIELKVENATVEPVDPLFLEPEYRLAIPEEEGGAQLVEDITIPVLYLYNAEEKEYELIKLKNPYELEARKSDIVARSAIRVRVARFPVGFVQGEPKYRGTDAYRRFQIRKTRRGMSFVRANREIETVDVFPRSEQDVASGLGQWPLLQTYAYHWGIEVRFQPELDKVFGITNDKQSVRPLADFWKLLAKEGIDDLLRRENAWQTRQREKPKQAEPSDSPSPAEQSARDADAAIGAGSLVPGERQKEEARSNFEEAVEQRAQDKDIPPEQARRELEEEINDRKYKIDYFTNAYGPPWEPDWVGLQVVVRINRAHPFYQEIYGQLLMHPEGLRVKQGLDVLMIALARAELEVQGQEDHQLAHWYETQRVHKWGPYLSVALKSLALRLQSSDGQEKEVQEYEDTALDFLESNLSPEEKAHITRTAVEIDRALREMGFQVHSYVDPEQADIGPSVVRYKIRLQSAEKISAIQGRSLDLMRELSAEKEPIIDNLPGTKYIYLDLPRLEPKSVLLRPYLETLPRFKEPSDLSCPIGVTPAGEIETLDISALPHMLVAGSTGSGKTMFLYALITGLTHLHSPSELQLVLIDPKQTDFVFFNDLPHLRQPVITDPREAIETLKDLLTVEIEARTHHLVEARARDLKTLNARGDEPKMPPIVVFIDEFADLADVMDGREQEEFDLALKRLAQRARNVGIHLIVATQRPSADIIKGAIKTNLPCRVSFRLASHVDSRTILDQTGAEKLLGKGDMLLRWNGEVTRLQGFYLPESHLAEIASR